MTNSDDLTDMDIPWVMADDVPKQRFFVKKPVVVNTGTNKTGGVHWIVVCRIKTGGVYGFDSLGPGNDRVANDGRNVVDAAIRRLGSWVHWYPYATQDPEDVLCGRHASYVVQLLREYFKGSKHRYPTTKGIDDYITKHFATVNKTATPALAPNREVLAEAFAVPRDDDHAGNDGEA